MGDIFQEMEENNKKFFQQSEEFIKKRKEIKVKPKIVKIKGLNNYDTLLNYLTRKI